mmetsp:Transcript_35038/g.76818  ORF Transcript_35038/g.76818 Transcript_35038/m.76818 type:complete len:471 (+) Transcript_35038:423-1835(+)
MVMLDDLEEAKKMESIHWDGYKMIRDALPEDNIEKDIYGKGTAEKQAVDFFDEYEKTLRSNAGRWMQSDLLPLAIGGTSQTSTVFSQWLCDVQVPDEDIKYHDSSHECEVDCQRFRQFLDALPEGTKDKVWEDYILNKFRDTIQDKIALGLNIWADTDEDIADLRHYIKSYMAILKHHTQSTEAGVQDIALCSAGGRSERDASALSSFRSVHLSPVNAEIANSYRSKKKQGNQHMGPGVSNDEREVKSARSRIRHAEGRANERGRYDIPSKEKSKAIIAAALKSTPTIAADKAVRAVMEKRKREDGVSHTAKRARQDQTQERRDEAELAIMKQANTKVPIALAETIAAAKPIPPPKYTNRRTIKSLSRTGMVSLTLQELEARYGEDVVKELLESIKDGDGKPKKNIGIRDLKPLMQQYEDCMLCSCAKRATRGPQCKCEVAVYFDLKNTTKIDQLARRQREDTSTFDASD